VKSKKPEEVELLEKLKTPENVIDLGKVERVEKTRKA